MLRYHASLSVAMHEWLKSLPEAFNHEVTQSQLIVCPDCKGHGITRDSDRPELCKTCNGKAKVSPPPSPPSLPLQPQEPIGAPMHAPPDNTGEMPQNGSVPTCYNAGA